MLGARAARADEQARPRSPLTGDEREDRALRERVLGLAQEGTLAAGGTLTPEAVVDRATAYLAFIQGGSDGRAG